MNKEVLVMAFLAHWVESWNWLLWRLDDLHHNPQHRWRWIWLWPLYTLMGVLYLFGKKEFDVVDDYRFKDLSCRTVLIRNFAWHFAFGMFQERIKRRIFNAVLALQEAGVKVIGLGALTKAEWLTGGGELIVKHLGEKLSVPIVHGDTLTAAVIIKQALRLIEINNVSKVFITGATSKIGRAVVLALAQDGVQVKMFTNSQKRFKEIWNEAGECGGNITWATTLDDGRDCDLWITGKAIPKGRELLKYIPQKGYVLNFSVPNPITEKQKKYRKDLYFCEGGLLAYNPEDTDKRFNMRLPDGITYACHAGTLVHASEGWTHHEVGPVDMKMLEPCWLSAQNLGFFLPPI